MGTTDTDRIKGTRYEAWDFKFGLIDSEDPLWEENALQNGTLDNRELSSRITKEQIEITFPLPGEFARCGFTFEYRTAEPDISVNIEIILPDQYDGGSSPLNETWFCPGKLRGSRGRFAFFETKTDTDGFIIVPGIWKYRVSIDGVLVKEWLITLTNNK